MPLILLSILVGLAAAVAGIHVTEAHRRMGVLLPFNAGVLVGIAAFGVVPELALDKGWAHTLALFTAGFLSLWFVDRYIYPVCPTCAHDHDHYSCAAVLHGFAAPLVTAAALHSFLDGWGIATSTLAKPAAVRFGVPLAVVLHKVPEGLALGGILRASVGRWRNAFAWSALAQTATAAGGGLGLALVPRLGSAWVGYPMGIAAGWLFYLGAHALHGAWRRRFVPALAGAAGVAALQQAVHALIR